MKFADVLTLSTSTLEKINFLPNVLKLFMVSLFALVVTGCDGGGYKISRLTSG